MILEKHFLTLSREFKSVKECTIKNKYDLFSIMT